METLLQIAKRFGIKPNPNMTKEQFRDIEKRIRSEFDSGTLGSLAYALYKKRKKNPQIWNENQAEKNIRYLKTMTPTGIRAHNQYNGRLSLDQDATFIWHSARRPVEKYQERFAVSVQVDHPNFPVLCQALDAFIKKHHASFKITDFDHIQRTDTLNVYMTREITPEIAKELCGIVKPFLKHQNHEYLDGFSLKENGLELKGIKYGPEPILWEEIHKNGMAHNIANAIRNRLTDLPKQFNYLWTEVRDAESLGLASANVQYLDLLYYLAGKEGQNPFQLGNLYGLPLNGEFSPRIARKYVDKKIDVASLGTQNPVLNVKSTPVTPRTFPKVNPVDVSKSVPEEISPSLQRRKTAPVTMQDLMKELSAMRSIIQSARSEVKQLKQGNVQLKQGISQLQQENSHFLSQNRSLQSRTQLASSRRKSSRV